MAMEGQLVAVLTPRRLHIVKVEFHGENPIRAHPLTFFDLDHVVAFAHINFTSSAASGCSLRVCLSNSGGVYAYSMDTDRLAILSATIQDHLVWSYALPKDPEHPEDLVDDQPFFPSFGHSIDSVSWIEGALGFAKKLSPMRFITLTSGLAATSSIPQYYVMSGLEMPALYAMCVRDYDDGLGLLAFGNGFGELALYNLRGTDLSDIRSCLKPVLLPSWDGGDRVNIVRTLSCSPSESIVDRFCPFQTSIAAHVILLFRFGMWKQEPSEAYLEELRQLWLSHRPRETEYWSADFFTRDDMNNRVGNYFQCVLGGFSWNVEHAWHYYGRPIPLLHHDTDSIIFKAGGLVFLADLFLERTFVLRPNHTIQQLADNYDGSDEPADLEQWFATEIWPDESAMGLVATVQSYWVWEVMKHKRDRWRELQARGGEVHEYWLTVDPSTLDY